MSNYVKSTNFAAKDGLPANNSGKIVKGAEIDTEFNAIATAVASKADTNSPTFTGTPLAPTANSGTNNTQIATTAFVQTALAGGFPTGGIVLWSGSIASIPSGWALCDGNNGTPNLRDRFIIGAGTTYAVAATGGSADAVVVSHTHTASTDSVGAHTHTTPGQIGGSTFLYSAGGGNPGLGPPIISAGTTSTAGAHTHTVTVASTGSSGTNANLPPYYALAYIMKL